ncbi:MAG: DUF4838 domain-containing protein [Lentisphaeria bacterium]|nr:DUF4838 domain-containing protein [Lentisphaeria bacterium]
MKKIFIVFVAFFAVFALAATGKPVAVFGHPGDVKSISTGVLQPANIAFEKPQKWLTPAEMSKYSVIYFGERRPAGALYSAALENFVKDGGTVIFTGSAVVSFTGKTRDLSKAANFLGFSYAANMNKVKVSAVEFNNSAIAKELGFAGKKEMWNTGFNVAATEIKGAQVVALMSTARGSKPAAITVNKVGKGEVWWVTPIYFRFVSVQKNTGFADEEGRFILTESGKNIEALKQLYLAIFRRNKNIRESAPVKSTWGTLPLGGKGTLTYSGKFKNHPVFKDAAPVLKNAFKLSDNGNAVAQIIVTDRKLRPLGAELKYHLDAITGGKFAVSSKRTPGKPALILDNSQPSNRVIIKTSKDTVTFQGNVSMAVYYYLEKLGCRYLWPGKLGKIIPKKPTLFTPELNFDAAPLLGVRRIRHGGKLGERGMLGLKRCGITDFKAVTKARSAVYLDAKDNANFYEWHGIGGSLPYSWGHTFGSYYTRYGKTNPDFFALQPDGTRSQAAHPDRSRLCMSNEKLIKTVAANLISAFKKKPKMQALSVCLNDGGRARFCMCKDCRKLDPENAAVNRLSFNIKGIPTAVKYVHLTDRVIHFSNRIAEEVNKVLPGKKVTVYVYSCYSAPPVKVKPSPSLVLLSTAMNYTTDDARNSALKTIASLGEFGNELLWRPNALRGFGNILAPQNYARRMFEDTELLKANNLRGTDFDCNEQHWSCKGLVYYALSKALWNPDRLSYDAIVDDYCRAGFGKAAPHVKEYYTKLEKIFDDAASRKVDYCEALTMEKIGELDALLKQADAAADNADDKARVKFLQLGLDAGRFATGLYNANKARDTQKYKALQIEYRKFIQKNAIESPLSFNPGNIGFRTRFIFR